MLIAFPNSFDLHATNWIWVLHISFSSKFNNICKIYYCNAVTFCIHHHHITNTFFMKNKIFIFMACMYHCIAKNDWLCSIYSPLGCYIPKLFFCYLEKLSMHVLPNLANKVLRVLCACSHVSYIIVFQKHTYEKWAWHFTSHCQGNGISELVPVIVCIPEKGYSLKNM